MPKVNVQLNPADVVATVGNEEISIEQCRLYLGSGLPLDVKTPDAREKALFTLFNNTVLAQRARAELPAADQDAARKLAWTRVYKMWGDLFLLEKVLPLVVVTEDELLRLAGPQEPQYWVTAFVNEDKAQVWEVLEAVEAGRLEEFDEAVLTRNEPLVAKSKGTLKMTPSYDRFPEDVVRTILALDKGKYSGLLETSIGFAVFRMDDMRTAEEVQQLVAESLRDNVQAAKEAEAYAAAREGLRELFAVEVQWAVLERYNGLIDTGEVEDARALLDETVVTEQGESWFVLGDFVQRGGAWHNRKVVEGPVLDTVDSELMKRVILEEGVTVDNQGGFQRLKILEELFEKHELARRYVDHLTAGVQVSQQELEDYFDEHRAEFALPDRRRVSVLQTLNQGRVEKAQQLLQEGTPFVDVVAQLSDHVESKKQGGDVGYVGREAFEPAQAEQVFAARKEQVVGPFTRVGQKGKTEWWLFQLTEILPPREVELEEIDQRILMTRIATRKRSDTLQGVREQSQAEQQVDADLIKIVVGDNK